MDGFSLESGRQFLPQSTQCPPPADAMNASAYAPKVAVSTRAEKFG
jgi:hypothetical protein